MIIGMPWAIACWYGIRPDARAARELPIVTTQESVLRVAKPIPGKCFITGWTCADSRPVARALATPLVRIALNDQVLPCRYMNDEVEAGTSATGARSTLMPRPRGAPPVFWPCVCATDASPSVPICH